MRWAGEDEGVGVVGHEPLAACAFRVNLWFHHFVQLLLVSSPHENKMDNCERGLWSFPPLAIGKDDQIHVRAHTRT